MSDRMKSFVFAGIMCIVCSLLLTAASSGLKKFQLRNIIIDKSKNILASVNLIDKSKKYSPKEIEKLYNEKIRKVCVDNSGKIHVKENEKLNCLSLYLYMVKGEIKSYIIPIESRGLWGKIYGYLAIEKDGATISGFTVYKHNETPGLGGEIEKEWFGKNFRGKKITSYSGDFVSIKIAKGKAKDKITEKEMPNYVDGISGATLTGKFLTGGIRKTLEQYEPISIKFRQKKIFSPM